MTVTSKHPSEGFAKATALGNDLDLFRGLVDFKLLVAIENDDMASAVIKLSNALVARGARPSVFRALEVMAPPPGSDDAAVLYEHAILGKDLHVSMQQSLRELIEKTLGHSTDWRIRTVGGNPSECILEEADAEKARVIIMGIHSHGSFSQAIGENTATRVMAKTKVPVLGIRSTLNKVPQTIMVATDFGFASRKAAHLAANLAAPGGKLILVHVAPSEWIIEEGDEGAALVQREGIDHAFEHLVSELSTDKRITIETMKKSGDPQTELMAAAEALAPEMIAIASHRHHVVTRLLLGSVTRKLVREGKWSMLVVPPTSGETYRKQLRTSAMKMGG
jgi:nucleotide-binding universal stress UspA family protein